MRELDATPPDVRTHRDVYEPAEDSWLLLKAMAVDAAPVPGAVAADVGTGTGIAAAWLAREGAGRVVAVDVSPAAATLAQENARALRVADRVRVVRGHLLDALRGPFDVVAFNPPYLASDEEERVDGWLDHAFHEGDAADTVPMRFLRDLPRVLAPGGRAYVLLSDRGNLEGALAAARDAGLDAVEVAREGFFFERLIVYRVTRA